MNKISKEIHLREMANKFWQSNKGACLLLMCIILLIFFRVSDNFFSVMDFNPSDKVLFLQTVCFLVPCLIYFWVEKNKASFRFNMIKIGDMRFIFLFSIVMAIVSVIISSVVLLVIGAETKYAIVDVMGGGVVQLGFLMGAVIPALCEETLLRGPVLSEFGGCKRGAIILSGLTFAMLHATANNFISPFIAGCVYSVLTIWYNSIIPAIFCHFINNAYIIIISKLLMVFPGEDAMMLVMVGNFIILLICVYKIISRYENNKEGFNKMGQSMLCAIDYKEMMRTVISPPFLLFVCMWSINLFI